MSEKKPFVRCGQGAFSLLTEKKDENIVFVITL